MIVIISAVLWVLYACLEGSRDARHYYYRVSSTRQDTHNEHSLFAVQRGIVLILFSYMSHNYLNGLCFAFMFPLWHDGVYYFRYNKLAANYPLGFWATSSTSTSWMDKNDLLNPVMRITYFIIGAVALIIINYAKY